MRTKIVDGASGSSSMGSFMMDRQLSHSSEDNTEKLPCSFFCHRGLWYHGAIPSGHMCHLFYSNTLVICALSKMPFVQVFFFFFKKYESSSKRTELGIRRLLRTLGKVFDRESTQNALCYPRLFNN